MKRELLGGVLGILVAVQTTGCGGGDALSKEQYVSKLDAMCVAFSKEEKKIGEPRTVEDLVEKGPRILDAFEKTTVDKVHKLKAPAEIADQANRLADLADQQRDVLAGLVEAAKHDDFGKVQELTSKNAAINKEAKSITGKLGAKECAR